mmetsp:Transcript_12384/g.43120  ORF Transcript_12384/g.43120 Transcript_12384/m.43120 type:complete len:266 (+) Transcript_12384:982-1779(+)
MLKTVAFVPTTKTRLPSDDTDVKLLFDATLYETHPSYDVHWNKEPKSPATTATSKNEVVIPLRPIEEGRRCVYQLPFHFPTSPSEPTAQTDCPFSAEIPRTVRDPSRDRFFTAREAKEISNTLPRSPPTYNFLVTSSASMHSRSTPSSKASITFQDSEERFQRASLPSSALAKYSPPVRTTAVTFSPFCSTSIHFNPDFLNEQVLPTAKLPPLNGAPAEYSSRGSEGPVGCFGISLSRNASQPPPTSLQIVPPSPTAYLPPRSGA